MIGLREEYDKSFSIYGKIPPDKKLAFIGKVSMPLFSLPSYTGGALYFAVFNFDF